MTTAKSAAFIGLWLKNCYLVGGGKWLIFGWRGEGNKNLAVKGSLLGEHSSWWLGDGGIIKFLAGEGGDFSPYPSPVGKTMQPNFGLSQVLGSILGPEIFLVSFTSYK